jgi:hypothetical protein
MPDKDLFQRTFAPGWRKVYRLSRDAAGSDSEVSDACVAAVAKSLRESKGCPGFNEIAHIVTDVENERSSQPLFAVGGVINLSNPLASIRQVEEKYKQNRMTKVAARAARSLLASEKLIENGTDWPKHKLAEKICLGLADHHFFGRGRNYLVEQRFGTFAEERAWENGVKEKMKASLSKLAVKLVNNPNAANIRAPGRIGIRRSTQELLNEPL